MFQSVIYFCLQLVSAVLVLYLKTAALVCVNDKCYRLVEVFCSFSKILLLEVSHHFYSNTLQ